MTPLIYLVETGPERQRDSRRSRIASCRPVCTALAANSNL